MQRPLREGMLGGKFRPKPGRPIAGKVIMRKLPLVLAILSFLGAIIVFVFVDGARSIYSGVFFAVIGVVFLVNARRERKAS